MRNAMAAWLGSEGWQIVMILAGSIPRGHIATCHGVYKSAVRVARVFIEGIRDGHFVSLSLYLYVRVPLVTMISHSINVMISIAGFGGMPILKSRCFAF